MEDALNLGLAELRLSESQERLPELRRREMAIMVVIEGLQILLVRFAGKFALQCLNDQLDALVPPLECRSWRLGSCGGSRHQGFVQRKADAQDVLFELVVGNPTVEIVVHLPHELEYLLLCDEETHTFQSLVELVDLDELVLVQVNLVEHLFESQPLLLEHLEQMVEDVVVGDHPLLLQLELGDPPLVVLLVELIEFCEPYDAISILVDLEEECGYLRLPQGQVKVATESGLEILESQEANTRVKAGEGSVDGHRGLDALLDSPQHSQTLELLLEACRNPSMVCPDACALRQHRAGSSGWLVSG